MLINLVRKAYEVDEVVPNKPNMTMKNIKERGSNSGGYVKEPEIVKWMLFVLHRPRMSYCSMNV